MLKLPYGVSSFDIFQQYGYHYVDRTPYIEALENLPQRYLMALRPRRFGKSLLISTLYYYYSVQTKSEFQKYFGKYYIGQHPTKEANSYLVLVFNFSGIDTQSPETTYRDFLRNVKDGIQDFFIQINFSVKEQNEILKLDSPQGVLQKLFSLLIKKQIKEKVYILIDEYDHFANELIAFKFNYFKDIVSQNGFVRKFYETIKIDTGVTGLVSRIFMTGVSPVTLDSLTSGFNIATNITTYPNFNKMFGFTIDEVADMYQGIGLKGKELEQAMEDASLWYDGYKFHARANNRIYNPDIVLYFGAHYSATGYYPDHLLDENIASDYGKM